MPENNEYELDENYEPLGIVDAADGSGTTWTEFIGQVNKMDNQVAALTEDRYSRFQIVEAPEQHVAVQGSSILVQDVPISVPDGYTIVGIKRITNTSGGVAVLSGYSLTENGVSIIWRNTVSKTVDMTTVVSVLAMLM